MTLFNNLLEAEVRRIRVKAIQELLEKEEVYCVQKNQSVLEVAQLMTEKNVGAVSALDGERLVGIFSLRDLLLYNLK